MALVAGNFAPERRPAAYGLVAAAGAIGVALGPLIGGLATTYASWRWVFVGEVVLVLVLLVARAPRRGRSSRPTPEDRPDRSLPVGRGYRSHDPLASHINVNVRDGCTLADGGHLSRELIAGA